MKTNAHKFTLKYGLGTLDCVVVCDWDHIVQVHWIDHWLQSTTCQVTKEMIQIFCRKSSQHVAEWVGSLCVVWSILWTFLLVSARANTKKFQFWKSSLVGSFGMYVIALKPEADLQFQHCVYHSVVSEQTSQPDVRCVCFDATASWLNRPYLSQNHRREVPSQKRRSVSWIRSPYTEGRDVVASKQKHVLLTSTSATITKIIPRWGDPLFPSRIAKLELPVLKREFMASWMNMFNCQSNYWWNHSLPEKIRDVMASWLQVYHPSQSNYSETTVFQRKMVNPLPEYLP